MKPKQRRQKNGLIITFVLGLGLTVVLLETVSMAPIAVAQTTNFPVTKFVDTNDGICDTDCSLREAIIAANATADPSTIILMAGVYTLTLAGANENATATGDLDITAPLTIVGAGRDQTIIDAGGLDRVFDVRTGAVVFSDLTVRNGNAENVFGGGILNEANLTLVNSVVRRNRAGSGGGIANRGSGLLIMTNSVVITNTVSGNGAGIVNSNVMTLINSTVSENMAAVSGGGIYNASGGDLRVTNGNIHNNRASSGGGISSSGKKFVLTNSTVSNNRDDGIFNTSGNNLLITHSTVSGNSGDGIANLSSNLTITNSTISHNASTSGAGIANFSSGIVTITYSTISSNTYNTLGGGIHNFSGIITLKNTIVANNSANDCRGVITSNGHNLDRDNSCKLTATGDLADTNPVLGPLQNNGGGTATHALLWGSPAIDVADNGACPANDQRGFLRPDDGDMNGSAICDLGAYEFVLVRIYLPAIHLQ